MWVGETEGVRVRERDTRDGGWRNFACQQVCVLCVPLPINPRYGAHISSNDVPSKRAQNGSFLSCRNLR